MLKFNDIKDKIVIDRKNDEKINYFNESDLKYWGTDRNKIQAFKTDQYYFILDYIYDENWNKSFYKIKCYDIGKGKVNTLISFDCFETTEKLFKILKENVNRVFTENQKEILNSGEIDFTNNFKKIEVYSSYLYGKRFTIK